MSAEDDAVARFSRIAREYCEMLESPQGATPVARVQVVLARLLAAGYELPEMAPTSDADVGSVPDERWEAVFRSTTQIETERDFYWTVFDPDPTDEAEPTLGSVADDLADIWRDVREGLDALDAGMAVEDVVWHWRFHLRVHWGKHAVEALRALHDIAGRS